MEHVVDTGNWISKIVWKLYLIRMQFDWRQSWQTIALDFLHRHTWSLDFFCAPTPLQWSENVKCLNEMFRSQRCLRIIYWRHQGGLRLKYQQRIFHFKSNCWAVGFNFLTKAAYQTFISILPQATNLKRGSLTAQLETHFYYCLQATINKGWNRANPEG